METNSQIDPTQYKPEGKVTRFEPDKTFTGIDESSSMVVDWISNETKSLRIESTPVATAFDVASYILDKMGSLTSMKLHKLLYYSQAWSLVWDEAPLFNEEIEAWSNGPVVRKLFAFHRGQYTISKIDVGNKEVLSQKQIDTIDSVLKYYGDKPAQWLIELTHIEDPWKNARIGLSNSERGDRVISLESMAEYYSSL